MTDHQCQRTRLANARTFLAWVRTGLGSIALAAAISHFGTFSTHGEWANLTAAGICSIFGLALIYAGYRHYTATDEEIE